jgi:hypothetical protein
MPTCSACRGRGRSPKLHPPIEVKTATSSTASQLDWWVKERQEWRGPVRGADGVNGGSELLIFVLRAAPDRRAAVRQRSCTLGLLPRQFLTRCCLGVGMSR